MLQQPSITSTITSWMMSARPATSPHHFSQKRAGSPLSLGNVSWPGVSSLYDRQPLYGGVFMHLHTSPHWRATPSGPVTAKRLQRNGAVVYWVSSWLRRFDMVSDPRKQDVVSWSPDGRR